jgi:hypothetical protein
MILPSPKDATTHRGIQTSDSSISFA